LLSAQRITVLSAMHVDISSTLLLGAAYAGPGGMCSLCSHVGVRVGCLLMDLSAIAYACSDTSSGLFSPARPAVARNACVPSRPAGQPPFTDQQVCLRHGPTRPLAYTRHGSKGVNIPEWVDPCCFYGEHLIVACTLTAESTLDRCSGTLFSAW
jgi:hypothetical protein